MKKGSDSESDKSGDSSEEFEDDRSIGSDNEDRKMKYYKVGSIDFHKYQYCACTSEEEQMILLAD